VHKSSVSFWAIFVSVEEQDSSVKELHTSGVGSQEPSYLQFSSHCLCLDDNHVAGDNVATLPLLFNPMEKVVF